MDVEKEIEKLVGQRMVESLTRIKSMLDTFRQESGLSDQEIAANYVLVFCQDGTFKIVHRDDHPEAKPKMDKLKMHSLIAERITGWDVAQDGPYPNYSGDIEIEDSQPRFDATAIEIEN